MKRHLICLIFTALLSIQLSAQDQLTLPNKKVVAAMGDQWRDDKSDMVWLKDIHTKLPKIDVLAMDCWIHDYEEHLADFSPRLLVSQHENEIGAHGIDHREAYWITLYKNNNIYKLCAIETSLSLQ